MIYNNNNDKSSKLESFKTIINIIGLGWDIISFIIFFAFFINRQIFISTFLNSVLNIKSILAQIFQTIFLILISFSTAFYLFISVQQILNFSFSDKYSFILEFIFSIKPNKDNIYIHEFISNYFIQVL